MYKAQKVQKYALNWQLQALQILINDDEVENWSLSSFLLAVSHVETLKECITEINLMFVHSKKMTKNWKDFTISFYITK